MKIFKLLVLVSSAAVAASCSLEPVLPSPVPGSVDVLFSVPAGVKSSPEALSLDVLAFRRDSGILDAAGTASGTGLTLSLSAGVLMNYYAVANVRPGTFSDVRSENDLLGMVSALEDSAGGNPVMCGQGTGVFDTDGEVCLEIGILASGVKLESVSAEFLDELEYGAEVVLRRVYLLNACGSAAYFPDGGDVPLAWYNALSYGTAILPGAAAFSGSAAVSASPESSGTSAVFASAAPSPTGYPDVLKGVLEKELDIPVENSSPIGVGASLLCCPNPFDNGLDSASNPLWCPRNTRLVLEVGIGGETVCYPATLPALESGRLYVISRLRLCSLGSPNPDIPLRRSAVTFVVSVRDWETERSEMIFERTE